VQSIIDFIIGLSSPVTYGILSHMLYLYFIGNMIYATISWGNPVDFIIDLIISLSSLVIYIFEHLQFGHIVNLYIESLGSRLQNGQLFI